MDPKFSIADECEGLISYSSSPTEETPFYLTPEQWNAISGGSVQITRAGQSGIARWPGPVNFSMKNSNMEFLGDGKIKFHGNLEITHTYPNAYIFCVTALDNDEPVPDPSTIDKSYNSYYEFKPESLNSLVELLGNLLHQSLKYQDICFDHLQRPLPLSIPMQETGVSINHRQVDYFDERKHILMSPSDFEINSLENRYQHVIFEKSNKYTDDKEYRFVFFVQHPKVGVLSVKKEPKIITFNNMASLLS
jgi:hypothetical protein